MYFSGFSEMGCGRCDETPHHAHRTTSRRERRVTGRFAPSSFCLIGRIQCFLNVSCLFS